MIPVFSSTVLASTIVDDQILVGCTIGDDQLTASCIGDDQLNILGGIMCPLYTGEIFIIHDNIYLMGNKTLMISHVITNDDTEFSSTTSNCTVILTMPNGTMWQTVNLTNNTDGVNNVTVDFNNTISGAWIADYSCSYSYYCNVHNTTNTFTDTKRDGFYVTSYGGVLAYLDTAINEILDKNISFMLGVIFIFIGIIYLYNIYKHKTYKKYKFGD